MPAAAKIEVSSGSATSDVATGLTTASGRRTSVVSGGNRKPIAASFGGSFHHTRYASVRRLSASKTTTWSLIVTL